MESSNQLDIVERFSDLEVNIIGTRECPLFNAKDILVNVLRYKDKCGLRWWKDIKSDPEMVKNLRVQNAQSS